MKTEPNRSLLSTGRAVSLVVALGSAALAAQSKILAPELLTPIAGVTDPDPAGIKRSRAVSVDVPLLRRVRAGHVLRLRMFADADFEARFERVEVEPHVPNTFHWHGKLVGLDGSQFVITVHEGAVAAWIYPNDARFQSLALQGDSGHVFARELVNKAHECHGAPKARVGHASPLSSSCNDNPDRVKVLLVYDDTAKAKGETAVRASILNGLATANVALGRTNLSIRWIAATTPRWISYKSSGSTRTDLNRLTHRRGHKDDPSGYMDAVHSWRLSYDADLVALVPGSLSGGIAWCAGGARSAASGFSVTGYKSLGAQTLTHELGHNYGCAHDPLNTDCKPTSYGRGHNWLFEQRGFPTYLRIYGYSVMSYSSKWGSCGFPWSCSKTRVPVFSSPFIKVRYNNKDYVTGTSTRDNRRVIVTNRQNVANYSIDARGGALKPKITKQPTSVKRCVGYQLSTLRFTCSATGHGRSITYQWRKNGTPITGNPTAKTASLTMPSTLSFTHAGAYDCEVTSCAGTVTTAKANLSFDLTCRVTRMRFSEADSLVVRDLGDWDGDGYGDYVVGNPLRFAKRGRIEIWSGRLTKPLVQRNGIDGNGLFGTAIAGGHVDNDDKADAVVSAPGAEQNKGSIYALSGPRIRRIWTGPANARAGTALSLARLNADSLDDLVVVARDTLYARKNEGSVIKTWSGLWSVKPIAGVDISTLATLGDVNGDGRDDVVIGLPSYSSNRGRWEIRSGADGRLIRAYNGSPGERIGASLAATGDLNGDLVGDFVVGAPGKNSNKGLVLTVSGRTGAFLTYTFGTVAGNRLGFAVASAGGDVDGDGVPDVLVSEVPTSTQAKGRVRALSGKALTRTLWSRVGNTSRYGAAIEGLETNGNETPATLIAESNRSAFVWLHDGISVASPDRFFAYGTSCLGTANRLPRLVQSGPARVDSEFTIGLEGMRPGSAAHLMLGVGRASVPLDAVGMKGCRFQLKQSIVGFTFATSSGRRAVRFKVPNDRSLLRTKTTWQSLVLDSGANKFGLTATNAGEITIGAKR